MQFLERIDEKRQHLIGRLFNAINNLRGSLCEDKDVCSFECSSILLGSLMKEMRKINHLNRKSAKPYNGYSVAGLLQSISNFKSPHWYDISSHQSRRRHPCNLMQEIQPILDDIKESLQGFKLSDF